MVETPYEGFKVRFIFFRKPAQIQQYEALGWYCESVSRGLFVDATKVLIRDAEGNPFDVRTWRQAIGRYTSSFQQHLFGLRED
jgi:hypothetical protein